MERIPNNKTCQIFDKGRKAVFGNNPIVFRVLRTKFIGKVVCVKFSADI